ncbi:MAG: imidazolonepropionase [Candidatus Aminicenantes bacterium]|jgi:imidazolonepropionase
MNTADLVVTNCNQLLTCGGSIPKRKEALGDVGSLEGGCIASNKGKIVFIGSAKECREKVLPAKDCLEIDGRGKIGLPGFVDPHTHLPFAGSREDELLLRLQGYTYQQLAAKGLGIQTTVKATREASPEALLSLCLSRLDSMLVHGTTTVEAKSGYGLNLQDELKQLRVLKEADQKHPVDIVPTFLGAHEVPPEYKEKKNDYIELIIREMIPEVTKNKLAEFFDVFCEEGVYSVEETRKMVQAAKQAGLKIKIHADEFTSLGGAELAAEENATSAEHLIAISQDGISALSKSSTAAILLPGVSFFLQHDKKAPARELIDRGTVVALATDFNPGSSMTESMFFILQLAVFTLKMGIEEAINAATANAAYAVCRQKNVGSLEVGKQMDFILCEIPNYAHLAYHMGIKPNTLVIKNGRIEVKEGRRVSTPPP